MRIDKKYFLHKGSFIETSEWESIDYEISRAIENVTYPPGNDEFTINPTRKGNGVKPIKNMFVDYMLNEGWQAEWDPFKNKSARSGVDLAKINSEYTFLIEWETGNISSSHRAMNKMIRALQTGDAIGGILILPTRKFYNYLTDRIGNYRELEQYFELWEGYPITDGVLGIYAIEYDSIDENVPLIKKGSDGFGTGN